jgi:hypothetical protein
MTKKVLIISITNYSLISKIIGTILSQLQQKWIFLCLLLRSSQWLPAEFLKNGRNLNISTNGMNNGELMRVSSSATVVNWSNSTVSVDSRGTKGAKTGCLFARLLKLVVGLSIVATAGKKWKRIPIKGYTLLVAIILVTLVCYKQFGWYWVYWQTTAQCCMATRSTAHQRCRVVQVCRWLDH